MWNGSLPFTDLVAVHVFEFLVELVSRLFHADVLITEQAERIEALEAEIERLRAALANKSAMAAWCGHPSKAAPPGRVRKPIIGLPTTIMTLARAVKAALRRPHGGP